MIHHGDCVEQMAAMDAESIDAVVTDPPYGLEFMGRKWDRLDWRDGGGFSKTGLGERPTQWTSFGGETANPTCATCGGRERGKRKCSCDAPDWRVKGEPMTDRTQTRNIQMQQWHARWATEALRVAKPGAYLLAFGGTRTVHRLTVALEDAGWIIRDVLCWAYATGFPKSKSSLKPAWEPIVLARKPGPLAPLDIDGCRLPTDGESFSVPRSDPDKREGVVGMDLGISGADIADFQQAQRDSIERTRTLGRWPANVVLTDPVFDGDVDGVVGGGKASSGGDVKTPKQHAWMNGGAPQFTSYGDSGTYSRFFLIPKSSRSDREPDSPTIATYCTCETVKLGAWESEGRGQPDQMVSTSQPRATSVAPSVDGFDWSTSSSGSEPTAPSSPATVSTTSTATSKTTDSRTSDSSMPPPTSASTPVVSFGTGDGSSLAASAENRSRSTPITTSAPRAGPSTDDAGPAISSESSKPSACERCGREVRNRRERVNTHPT